MRTKLLVPIATVVFTTVPILAHATTWYVPASAGQITTILANPSCMAGDEILVNGALITTQDPFSDSKGVVIKNVTGHPLPSQRPLAGRCKCLPGQM